ncbi:MAG TPA: mannosyltransferase family protein [Selenomonadales bacterium]|nr:mannosyltransferase family protein [Selenomonadales bacterium]
MIRSADAVKTVGLAFLLHTAAVFAAVLLADRLPPHPITGFLNPTLPASYPVVEKLIRWDAHWYTYMAEYGYTAQTIVFFPAIVILIRAFTYLGLNYALAGFAVANIFTAVSYCLLYRLARLDCSEEKARRVLLAFAIMPTSFFLNSIYTEAVFLAFALACAWSARRGRWWWAGLFAALATLTRNIGILLVGFILLEIWQQRQRLAAFSTLSLLAAPAALIAFMGFNRYLTGDPLAFVHAQQRWGRIYGLPWHNIRNNIDLVVHKWAEIEPGVILDLGLVAVALLALLILTFSSRFQIRFSYLAIGWLWLVIPLFSTSPPFPLYSLARFVLVVFPLYFFIAQLPRPLFYTYLLGGTLLLMYCTALFANWYWIG